MRGVHFFMFLVALPALAALGHDAHLFYINQEKGFMFASLGFIWTNYNPESYKAAVEMLEPQGYWPVVNALLTQKAFFVGIAFAGFFYVILGLLRLLHLWPFNEQEITNFTGSRRVDELMGGNQGKTSKFKYNRK